MAFLPVSVTASRIRRVLYGQGRHRGGACEAARTPFQPLLGPSSPPAPVRALAAFWWRSDPMDGGDPMGVEGCGFHETGRRCFAKVLLELPVKIAQRKCPLCGSPRLADRTPTPDGHGRGHATPKPPASLYGEHRKAYGGMLPPY